MRPCTEALLLLLACAACSTGRIDVDIYKGPLTNEQDVQMHQLAAFAIGVKPVLVHVRDQMEAAARHVHVWDWRNRPGYRPGPMKNTGPLGGRAFVSREADYVNAVLELYLDAEETAHGGPFEAVRAGLERYRQAYRIVNAIDEEGRADVRAWTACVEARPALESPPAGSLAAAVKKYLVSEAGEHRNAQGLVRALQSAPESSEG